MWLNTRVRNSSKVGLVCLLGFLWVEVGAAQLPVPGGRTYPNPVPGAPTYPGDRRPPRRSPIPGDTREESIPMERGGPRARGPASDINSIRTYVGECQEVTKEQLTITTADHREFRFKLTKDTEYLRDTEEAEFSEVKKGDTVRVTSKRDDKGFLTASRVQIDTAAADAAEDPTFSEAGESGEAGEPAAAVSRPSEILTPVEDDPDDPGPPKLRRRTPEEIDRLTKEKAEQQQKEAELAANRPPPAPVPSTSETGPGPLRALSKPARLPAEPRRDEHIEKAREQALKFTETLPNFICRQIVARYQSLDMNPRDWDALDIIEAYLVFFEGEEDYQNIKVGYKKVDKPMEEIGGAWSKGEYGTVLRNIFEPWTLTEFRYRGMQMVSGRVGRRYEFSVERSRSQWEARMASESYLPAYKGTISIDEKTHRTLKIEMEAKHFPPDFPLNSLDMTVEYGLVRIGAQYHLLPVHSEIIACGRYTSMCSMNKIDFRNYRQFSSESTIFTSDSDVSFGNEEAPAEPEEKPGASTEPERQPNSGR